MTDMFYLMDSRSYVGNCVLWWRKGGHGYTTDLSNAEIYPRDLAEAMHETRASDKPVSVELARAVSRPTVDMQSLSAASSLEDNTS